MSESEAQEEARKRWGSMGRAYHYPNGVGPRFMVGFVAPLAVPIWREAWSGNSFEEAFAKSPAPPPEGR